MPSALDMFSGGGGFSEAAKLAGVQVVAACERDPDAAHWYSINHGAHVRVADCTRVDYREWNGIDLLLASPPCQEYSAARVGAASRHPDRLAGLAVARAIRAARPRWCIVENVRGFKGSGPSCAIVAALEEHGYRWQYPVVDFASWGLPQNRVRSLLIAALGETPQLPPPTHNAYPMPVLPLPGLPSVQEWRGWYEAIADLLPDCPRTKLAAWQVRELRDRGLVGSRPLLISTTNQRSFPWRLGSEPAPTVMTTHNTPIALTAIGYRKLSIRCMARLQGFPDSYRLPATKPLAMRLIGNAVPPSAMAPFIAALTQKSPSREAEAVLTKTI